MRRSFCRNAVLAASLALLAAGAVGCSDDDTGGSQTQDDTGTVTDASDSGQDTATEPQDTGDDAESDAGDTGSDAADTSDTTDTSDAGDTSDTADTEEPDPVDPSEGHTGCTFPADDGANCDPEDMGDYGPATFLSDFDILGDGECCRDFDNDGTVDSGLGELIEAMEAILNVTDFNEEVIAPQIQNGTIVFLFEYAYWSDAVVDDALEFNLIFGQDTDQDFTDNMAGTGDFLINPASLDNGEPKSQFPAATVSNAELLVSGGSAPLMLPVGTDLVETRVDDLQVTADVISGTADLHAGGRVDLDNGEISGYVTLEEMFSSLNTVAANCTCITTAPLFVSPSDDTWSCQATAADKDACQNASMMCQTLASPSGFQSCDAIKTMIVSGADVNLDDDNAEEAISLGATFEGVGASITGVAP